MSMEKGVDTSYHNDNIDWGAIRAAGYTFATMKISNGTKAQSPESEAWAKTEAPGLKSSGIPVIGGQHTLRPGNIATQVDWFLQQMTTLFGGWRGYVCHLDVEIWNDAYGTPSHTDAVNWYNLFQQKTGGYPLGQLYYPKWVWSQFGSPDLTVFKNAALHASDYSTVRTIDQKFAAYGGVTPKTLQYTSGGNVGGAADLNYFNGTLSTMRTTYLGVQVTDQAPSLSLPDTVCFMVDPRAILAAQCPVMSRGYGGPESAYQRSWVSYFFMLLQRFSPGYYSSISSTEIDRLEVGDTTLAAALAIGQQVYGTSLSWYGVIGEQIWAIYQP